MFTQRITRRSPQRPGITLLEVLFAIGVVAVGLLGVATLMPVALYYMGKANLLERARVAGETAMEDFHVYGMGRPGALVAYPASLGNNVALYDPRVSGEPFAIDPRFVAINGSSVNNTATESREAILFPYVGPPGPPAPQPAPNFTWPRMRRVSLRAFPESYNIAFSAMRSAHADAIFMSHDDLSFDIPADKTAPPIQRWSPSNAQRVSEDNFSWMATAVPRGTKTGAYCDEYTLSIVVFRARDATMEMNSSNERVVDVTSFDGGGVSGGEITVESDSLESLTLRTGDWLMLMGKYLVTDSQGNLSTSPVFQWYRVVGTNEPVTGSNKAWKREVTLHGADWPVGPTTYIPQSNQTRPVFAALVSNVVTVYEQSIRLDATSLWTP